MSERDYFHVEVGDRVMIQPMYWERRHHYFIEPYASNGPDHIYTITRISSDGIAADPAIGRYELGLDGMNAGWTNDPQYLLPLDSDKAEFTPATSDEVLRFFE